MPRSGIARSVFQSMARRWRKSNRSFLFKINISFNLFQKLLNNCMTWATLLFAKYCPDVSFTRCRDKFGLFTGRQWLQAKMWVFLAILRRELVCYGFIMRTIYDIFFYKAQFNVSSFGTSRFRGNIFLYLFGLSSSKNIVFTIWERS